MPPPWAPPPRAGRPESACGRRPTRRRRRGAAAAAALLLLAGRAAGAGEGRWAYEGDYGPERWWDATIGGSLECSGSRQSPIDIVTAAAEAKHGGFFQLWAPLQPRGEFRYLRNDGKTVVLDAAERGVTFVSSSFPNNMLLYNVHFHQRSEHTIDGKQFMMEMHLVFVPADYTHLRGEAASRKDLVVIGVLFDTDNRAAPTSPLADFILDKLPMIEGAQQGQAPLAWDTALGRDFRTPSGIGNSTVWLDGLEKDEYAEYEGSLTTPPCTEVVHWMVNLRPRRIDPRRLSRLENIINSVSGNARPVQPLNGRRVGRRRFYSPVHAAHTSEFPELKVALANFRPPDAPPSAGAVQVQRDDVDDATTKGLLAAVVILGVAVVLTVVGIFVTITVRKEESLEPLDEPQEGDDEEYEEDEEGEEEEDDDGD